MKIFRFLPLLVAGLLWTGVASRAQNLDWNSQTQGDFVFALAQGNDGFWVGTENQGVWRRDNQGQWRAFTRADGLGDDTALCLARRGNQLWAGHASGGLSVWDGAAWTNLGVEDGLPSERVTALGVNPQSSDVWVGTENGLLRWSDAGGWTVPDSSLCRRAIAGVSSAGDLVVAATSCEGLIVSRDGGASWNEVRGPREQPVAPTGAGLPSDVLNDAKIDSLGGIWVASNWGFARSDDAGKTWTFLRGADWKANLEGSAQGLKAVDAPLDVDLAAEDWVQTLAPTNDGRIWLGFRQKGAELRDCKSGETIFSSMDERAATHAVTGDWVRSIFPLARDRALIGRYAGGVAGLLQADFPSPLTPGEAVLLRVPTPLPALSAAELNRLADARSALAGVLAPGSAAWESLDFRTQGDWVGRYGNELGVTYSPRGDGYNRITGTGFVVKLGPHVPPGGDGPYNYYSQAGPRERRALYSPRWGERRLGEYNDGTWRHDLYSFAWEGPGLYELATVPAGAHRLSLYFVNSDGRGGGLERFRDYVVSLKAASNGPDDAGAISIEAADRAPDLARGRVRDLWSGAYARFSVVGPAKFWVKIARNRSEVTKISGIFLDAIDEGETPLADPDAETQRQAAAQRLAAKPMALMGGVLFLTEATPPADAAENETALAARRAWQALDEAARRNGGLDGRWQERLQIYRAAKAAGAPEPLLANWRWKLTLWREGDRDVFDATMKDAREKQLALEAETKAKAQANAETAGDLVP